MKVDRAKQIVKDIIESDLSYREIAIKYEVSLGTVNFWAKRIKQSNIELTNRKKGGKKINIEEFI